MIDSETDLMQTGQKLIMMYEYTIDPEGSKSFLFRKKISRIQRMKNMITILYLHLS